MVSTDNTEVPSYADRLRFDGRNLVVVGAGQGMGRQSSHALKQCGANVVCVDVEDARAKEIADEVGGIPWVGDATRRDEVERLVSDATAALGGRIHGFIDIVGMARFEDLLDLSDDTFDWEVDICVRHAYLLSQVIGRHMRDAGGGGTMVFIASVSAMSAAPRHAAYGAMKAALVAWVKSAAIELGPHGIRVNAVAPGSILTPRMDAVFNDQQRAENAAIAPLNRMGLPSDIAGAALFLSSDLAPFITGQTLVVDGGVTSKFPYGTL
jgi:NAD(P)-dependent dehydrogenase (short-subunit alcohol dehydrogenase family)